MRALVTGASHGLGSAIAARLRTEEYEVDDLPGEIIKRGKEAIDDFILGTPRPDVVVNNYGINHLSWIGDTPHDDGKNILHVNVMGPYWVINALVGQDKARPCKVVNIASQVYKVPQRTTALYCASKAALVMLTKVMARELAPFGWQINAVAPGKIEDTDMARLTDEQVLKLRGWGKLEADKYAVSLIPAGRYTTKVEVADVVYKTLELPFYVNGSVIEATGGV